MAINKSIFDMTLNFQLFGFEIVYFFSNIFAEKLFMPYFFVDSIDEVVIVIGDKNVGRGRSVR